MRATNCIAILNISYLFLFSFLPYPLYFLPFFTFLNCPKVVLPVRNFFYMPTYREKKAKLRELVRQQEEERIRKVQL